MSDREILRYIGEGIMERVPNLVRVRVNAATWQRLYEDLKACEYEYEFVDDDGQSHKAIMCMRWSRPGLNTPHVLVYGKPVEVDPTLTHDSIAFDGQESM